MKRKDLNAVKLKDVLNQDKKISAIYLKLKSILSKYKLNNSFAVAVSGGPDSMALVGLSNILMSEKKKQGFLCISRPWNKKKLRKRS